MSKIVKWGGGIFLVLLVLTGIAVFVLLQSVNDIIEATVEKVGSDITGTNVELGSVDISLTKGSGSLNQFRLENPDGFSPNEAFKFEKVSVTLDITSIASDPVIVKEVRIVSPDVTYEIGKAGSNFDALLANTKKNAAAQKSSSGGKAEKSEESGEKDTPNIIIKRVILEDGRVGVRIPALIDDRAEVDLPKIVLKDIGAKDKKGATPDVIAEEIISKLSQRVSAYAGKLDPTSLFKDLDVKALSQMKGFESLATDLQKSATKELENLQNTGKDLEKNLDENIEKGVGAIKGLLGN